YDDSKHFKVNKLPKRTLSSSGLLAPKFSNNNLFTFLEQLAKQKGTSNDDKAKLCQLASVDQETYEVVTRIVNKDAKCGFGGKTINKAYSDLLFLMPYCRCSTAKKKMHNIDYEAGAIGQEKADGMFSNIIIDKDGSSLIRSRNGNIVHQMDHLHDFFRFFPNIYRDTVYMGELLIMIDGNILPRKTGNGILNSCLQNAADHKYAGHAIIKLWDAVPQKDFWKGHSKIGYKHRLGRVAKVIKDMHNKDTMSLIKSKTLYSLEEAQKFYKQLRLDGKEGAIVKNLNAKWKDHTSPDQVKMKNVSDAELRIVSWKYGKDDTRFKDCMGSVQLESDDGLVKVSVSGFKDFEHFDIDWDERIGKVATLEYEGLTNDKSRPDIYSLYLPQNLEMRPDRSDTDTLKDLKTR
ncbi:MAG: hypothetical protein DRJ07_20910, partial [Bacteroidetes bacterium]